MRDLPEPQQRRLSAEEQLDRRWQLLVTAFAAATAYTLLHKLVIPLALKTTNLRTSPYAEIDWWFLYSLMFLYLLRRQRKLTPLLCFLAGMGVAYGLYEIVETARGLNPGWLAFSRLLSSLPIAGLCIVFLTQWQYGRRLVPAWSGAVAVFFMFALLPIFKNSSPAVVSSPTVASRSLLPTVSECGASSMSLVPEEYSTLSVSSNLVYEECGFRPTRVLLEGGSLRLTNRTSDAVNFHMVAQRKGRLQTLWNVLVPSGRNLPAPKIELRAGSVGMIYSDNRPAAGVVAVVSGVYVDHWRLNRSPLILEVTE